MISGQSLQWYTTGCSSIPAKEVGVADTGPRKTMESWEEKAKTEVGPCQLQFPP